MVKLSIEGGGHFRVDLWDVRKSEKLAETNGTVEGYDGCQFAIHLKHFPFRSKKRVLTEPPLQHFFVLVSIDGTGVYAGLLR